MAQTKHNKKTKKKKCLELNYADELSSHRPTDQPAHVLCNKTPFRPMPLTFAVAAAVRNARQNLPNFFCVNIFIDKIATVLGNYINFFLFIRLQMEK